MANNNNNLNYWSKDKFYSWLIGFIDAEGNFQTTKVKRTNKKGIITHYTLQYSFHLSLHIRDKILIEQIKILLDNRGSIFIYETRTEVRLAFVKKEDLRWLLVNVLTKYNLLTKHQLMRLEQLRFGLKNNINRIENLDDFNTIKVFDQSFDQSPDLMNINKQYWIYWLGGFINGEASFTFVTKKTKKIPRFFIEHTDDRIIYYIKDYFKFGPKVLVRTRDSRKTTYLLNITSKQDINSLINFLENNDILLGYKKYQYDIWKKEFSLLKKI